MRDEDAVKLVDSIECYGFQFQARIPRVTQFFRSLPDAGREDAIHRLVRQATADPEFQKMFGLAADKVVCPCPDGAHDGPADPEHILRAFIGRLDESVIEWRVMRSMTPEELRHRRPEQVPAGLNDQQLIIEGDDGMLHVTDMEPSQVVDHMIGAAINLVGNAVRECMKVDGVKPYDPDTDAGKMAWDALHLAAYATMDNGVTAQSFDL